MFYSRILSENADGVRRSAKDTVKAARETICRSENLLEHTRDVLERADKMLRNSVQRHNARAAKKRALADSKQKKGAPGRG